MPNLRSALWLGAIIMVALLGIVLSERGVLDPLRNAAITISSPFENAFRNAAQPVADYLNEARRFGKITSENQNLRSENERLQSENARLREDEARLQDLNKLLQVKERRPNDQFVAANVILKDPSSLREMVAIDRGRRDGISEGMVVLAAEGSLVGTVTSVLNDYSWVTLITDLNSNVNAMVQESRAQGVLSGKLGKQLSLDFVSQSADVKTGDTIVTSGLGGNYPNALLVGRVVKVEGTSQDLFKTIGVEPVASFSRLESVLVLTSFLPSRLERP